MWHGVPLSSEASSRLYVAFEICCYGSDLYMMFRYFASSYSSLKQFKACYVGFLQFVQLECLQFMISAGVACIIPRL